jgi:hypothetical protein
VSFIRNAMRIEGEPRSPCCVEVRDVLPTIVVRSAVVVERIVIRYDGRVAGVNVVHDRP